MLREGPEHSVPAHPMVGPADFPHCSTGHLMLGAGFVSGRCFLPRTRMSKQTLPILGCSKKNVCGGGRMSSGGHVCGCSGGGGLARPGTI